MDTEIKIANRILEMISQIIIDKLWFRRLQ